MRADSPIRSPHRTVIVKEGVSAYQFAKTNTVAISNQCLARVILPSAPSGGARRLASVTDLRRCVVDISGPSPSDRPLASLALKNIRDSLIICGRVDGPAHVTDVKRSTVVVRCHQFRMHDSQDVDIYLSCRTRPVIEYSAGLRFAPMPDVCGQNVSRSASPQPQPPSSRDGGEAEDQWSQIDDFNWLKPTTGPVSSTEDAQTHSPNWAILPAEERLTGGAFEKVIHKLHLNSDDSSSGHGSGARNDDYQPLEGDDDGQEQRPIDAADGAEREADAENDKEEKEKGTQEAREVETMLDKTVPRLRPRRRRS